MKTGKIKMTFVCDQEWGQMKANGPGKHCEICHTIVYDFTEKKKTEIEQHSNTQASCGMFLPEQVATDLIPIEIPYQNSLLKFFLTIATVLGLQINQMRGQELPKKDSVEIVENKNLMSSIVSRRGRCDCRGASSLKQETILDQKNQKENSSTQNKSITDTYLATAINCDDTQPKRHERKKYFLTKRFPFIVRRKIGARVVGRYRM